MAVDEAAELHGMLSKPLRGMLHASGALYFTWTVPYLVLTLAFAISYRRFYFALPRRLRLLLGAAGVVYVFGALVLELVGSAIVSTHGGLDGGGLDDWRHAIAYTCEEFFEMAGIVLAVYTLLCHVEAQSITASLRVLSASRDGSARRTPA